ncbi:sigma-70 family RNA polymerase sigma factor [Porticoccus sp. W117]|uniref:RNA polymerase sigma factor n=1 Tax=Porticoccus sp. W117 TaxID=3054777 RepID=UPI002597A668|nr:sigma-70 family RNA polymerase sigma factor [Porticoccus sp. W117]MDM3871170.1 sigma-70 family RNA polymerase sigma factor [Porticoccus sp. W117]
MTNDDRTLIARVLTANDQRAYRELVNRYQSQLRYSLRQLTGWDEALADDLAQETFIKAFANLSSFRGDANFYTWLYRIAYRQFASYYRSRKPTEPLSENEDDHEGHTPAGETDLHRDISRALAQLPPEQAMALHLHLQREHTHQEISQIMDSPLGTVKSHIQRGREKLKVLLSAWQTTVTP